MGQELKFDLFGDVFNVFNTDANQGVLSRLVDVDTFAVPSDFILPRRVMLGAKLMF